MGTAGLELANTDRRPSEMRRPWTFRRYCVRAGRDRPILMRHVRIELKKGVLDVLPVQRKGKAPDPGSCKRRIFVNETSHSLVTLAKNDRAEHVQQFPKMWA